jgi:type IV secretory pathway TrbD component
MESDKVLAWIPRVVAILVGTGLLLIGWLTNSWLLFGLGLGILIVSLAIRFAIQLRARRGV